MWELYFRRILFGVTLLILIARWVGRRNKQIYDEPDLDGPSGEIAVAKYVGKCTVRTVDNGTRVYLQPCVETWWEEWLLGNTSCQDAKRNCERHGGTWEMLG